MLHIIAFKFHIKLCTHRKQAHLCWKNVCSVPARLCLFMKQTCFLPHARMAAAWDPKPKEGQSRKKLRSGWLLLQEHFLVTLESFSVVGLWSLELDKSGCLTVSQFLLLELFVLRDNKTLPYYVFPYYVRLDLVSSNVLKYCSWECVALCNNRDLEM